MSTTTTKQAETCAADSLDEIVQGRSRNSTRARGGTRSLPEVVQAESTELSLQQRLQLIEVELKKAQDQRLALEERLDGIAADGAAMERRLRAEINNVAKQLATLDDRLDLVEQSDDLHAHVRALRAQVDNLARRISRRPIRAVWEVGFSFLTL